MSTFKGVIDEFRHIRIDYFRHQPGYKAPLACFLSHIHSDHLTGLESLRAPFVYCSAATREILLRLEKYHYRVNYARGILESHNVTYDRSMRKLAKPLPLDTPTTIELAPGDGKAILYTGDIRAEPWWVNSLVQNPVLLPYTLESKALDCIYLDTTFATKSNVYREFPSKAEGIKELLQKVGSYPDDTVFYFHSWTFGYENVWIALSNFLQSRIHLDDYRACIYASLSTLDKKSLHDGGLNVQKENTYLQRSGLQVHEAPALCGFRNGNHMQPGCLTSNSDVRIHSCERGMGCAVMDQTNPQIVHIVPIVNRVGTTDILEAGAGGGHGDLNQAEELETGDMEKMAELCSAHIKDPEILSKVLSLFQQALDDGTTTINLSMNLQNESPESESELAFPQLATALSSRVSNPDGSHPPLHNSIRFPYSRHSSYSELCNLVDAFKPKDVFPCTVNEANWDPSLSMRSLFGSSCSGDVFRHDLEMMAMWEARRENEMSGKRTRETQSNTQESDTGITPHIVAKKQKLDGADGSESDSDVFHTPATVHVQPLEGSITADRGTEVASSSFRQQPPSSSPPKADATPHDINPAPTATLNSTLPPGNPSTASKLPTASTSKNDQAKKEHRTRVINQKLAYDAALGFRLTWDDFGGLVCTKKREDLAEFEVEL
ncbi:unnamed protein product [Periconia digitata]|uniref:Protein artemis n=1 Tax=Periconia digitata TaxID=1303443 RepID=A0A9W4XVH0_9PLEO|nr:unnamed protein product [Periconia digitata]